MSYREIDLTCLLLDVLNPRLADVKGQAEVLHDVIREDPSKLVNLAKDIVENGLSPIDIPYVIHQRGNLYEVVEGNRRIAALKLLANPDLAKGTSVHVQFIALAKKATVASKVYVAVASDRDEARHWIKLRHTGENAGRGVVDWNTAQRERFDRTRGTQADLALTLCDALQPVFEHDGEFGGKIVEVRNRRLNVLGRLLIDADVRKRLGLEFDDGTVAARFTSKDLEGTLRRVIGDIASGSITTRSFDKKPDRQKYLEKIGSVLPEVSKRMPYAAPFEKLAKGKKAATKKQPTKKAAKSTTKSKPPPVFAELELDRMSARIPNILDELRALDLEKFPNAGVALIRVLVEMTIQSFFDSRKWGEVAKLHTAVHKCADTVDPTRADKSLEGVRAIASDPQHLLSVKTLQRYLHNAAQFPSPTDLRAMASNFEPLLQLLNNNMPKKK